MQFSTIIVSFFASVAVASPAKRNGGGDGGGSGSGGSGGSGATPYTPCTDTLYSQAECCSVDVLGVADLNCATVSSTPTDATDFQAICAVSGQEPMCCTLDLLEIGVLCNTPTGL